MLPHPKGEADSIARAFHECSLGLQDLPRDGLDENARSWVARLEELMNTDGLEDPLDQGLWAVKADALTVGEKTELSNVVDSLAYWFDRESP